MGFIYRTYLVFVYRTVFCNQQEKVTFWRTIYLVTVRISAVETKPHDIVSDCKLPKVQNYDQNYTLILKIQPI